LLKNIPHTLSPELLKVLMEMGHGDQIVIGDGNFPSASHAKRLIRCDGLGIPELLQDILTLFPLDTYVNKPVTLMQLVEGDDFEPTIWNKYQEILLASEEENTNIQYVDRFDFYEKSKNAYAIIATSEKSLYANIILQKGVISS